MTRAAVYARISKDDEDRSALGVARQIEDCTAEAERRGWEIVAVYPDNDRSATNGRARPEYQRMLADVRAGRIDAVVVWDVDRLTRTPRELEDVIDLANSHGVRLANVGGDIDLATDDGRMMARIKGTVARREVEASSRRIRRKNDERALAGQPHSRAPYGWRRVVESDEYGRPVSRDVIADDEADVVRETAQRLLAGESMRSIAASLNERGSTSPGGKPWLSTTLRQVMMRDSNAGLRTHRGEVVGRGAWEPLIDEGTHARVVAALTDPMRRTNRGPARRHLLSGIARCGLCGGDMRVAVSHGSMAARYQCKRCYKVARRQSLVDDFVERLTLARLEKPDALSAIAAGRPERAQELRKVIDDVSARLDLAADQFADGAITAQQLRRITAKLRPRVDEASRELAACLPEPQVLELAGERAAEMWGAAPLEVKRQIIDMLMTITLLPVGRGRGRDLDPDTVRIEWRST